MPIDADTLAAIADDYARGMTSIRGRRVQRLIKREFAGAARVLPVKSGASTAALLGVSASGAALCATDGRGKAAAIVKWRHGSTQGLEVRFDLLKDSLQMLDSRAVAIADACGEAIVRLAVEHADAYPLV